MVTYLAHGGGGGIGEREAGEFDIRDGRRGQWSKMLRRGEGQRTLSVMAIA